MLPGTDSLAASLISSKLIFLGEGVLCRYRQDRLPPKEDHLPSEGCCKSSSASNGSSRGPAKPSPDNRALFMNAGEVYVKRGRPSLAPCKSVIKPVTVFGNGVARTSGSWRDTGGGDAGASTSSRTISPPSFATPSRKRLLNINSPSTLLPGVLVASGSCSHEAPSNPRTTSSPMPTRAFATASALAPVKRMRTCPLRPRRRKSGSARRKAHCRVEEE